jgi:hypothetical protein
MSANNRLILFDSGSRDLIARMPVTGAVDDVSPAATAQDITTLNSNTHTTMSDNINTNKVRVSERAQGRWKLLRRAIVRSAATATANATTATATETTDQDLHSIHCFAGYHLLPPSASSVTRVSRPGVWEQLLRLQVDVHVNENDVLSLPFANMTAADTESSAAGITTAATDTTALQLLQMLVDSILALTAMDPDCRSLEFSVSVALSRTTCHDDTDTAMDTTPGNKNSQNLLLQQLQHCTPDWSLQLQRCLAWKLCDCQWREEVVAQVPEPVPLQSQSQHLPARIARNASATTQWMLRIQFEPVDGAHSQYTIREYSTDTAFPPTPTLPPPIVLARERMPDRQVSLQELVSHHYQRYDNDNKTSGSDNSNTNTNRGGIDNTGNICVWDCEKTLAWVLLREQKQQVQAHPTTTTTTTTAGPRIVTELGAGMVGLAGLCLVAAAAANHNNGNINNSNISSSNGTPIQELYLTDGHVDSVQNNRVHVRLGQAAAAAAVAGQLPQSSSACRVHCSVLKWSIDSDRHKKESDDSNTHTNTNQHAAVVVDETSPPQSPSPPPADWTLISDCTHFEEYHAELFWTLIKCTVSTGDGTIWMCQPTRGKSLDRFLDLVRAVNDSSENDSKDDDTDGTSNTMSISSAPLVLVQEQHYETLRVKHDELLQRDKTYDPNIHRPRVFCLRKLRAETEQDRLAAIRHIQER